MGIEQTKEFILAKQEKDNYSRIFNDIEREFGPYGNNNKTFSMGQNYLKADRFGTLSENDRASTTEPLYYINMAASCLSHFVIPATDNSISLQPLSQVLASGDGIRDISKANFFENAGRVLQKIIMNPSQGFHGHLTECIKQLLLYGNTAFYVDTSNPLLPIFTTIDFREILIYRDDSGQVVKIFREFVPRHKSDASGARKEIQEWSLVDNVADPKAQKPTVEYVHYDGRGGIKEKAEYLYWPIFVASLTKDAGFQYGSGLGLLLLPHVQRLNAFKRMLFNASHLQVQPPLQFVASSVIQANFMENTMSLGRASAEENVKKDSFNFEMRPGQICVTKTREPAFQPIPQSLDLNPLMTLAQQEMEAIRAHSLIDVLTLADLSGSPSIEEVTERVARKQQLLGPMVSSVQEIIDGVVKKIFYSLVASENRKLVGFDNVQIAEEELNDLHIQYENQFTKLPLLKKSRELADLAVRAANLAQVDPSFVDKLNMDKLIDNLLSLEGYGYLAATEEEVQQKREERSKANAG